MLSNNSQRLGVWLKLDNKFDYISFEKGCVELEIEPLPILEFAQKVGMLEVAKNIYPDLSVSEAYLKLITEFKIVPTAPQNIVPSGTNDITAITTCGSCGGGTVR